MSTYQQAIRYDPIDHVRHVIEARAVLVGDVGEDLACAPSRQEAGVVSELLQDRGAGNVAHCVREEGAVPWQGRGNDFGGDRCGREAD